MTLQEYAEARPASPVDGELNRLYGELREIDYRNDPIWSRRQDEDHNKKILRKIEELEERRNK